MFRVPFRWIQGYFWCNIKSIFRDIYRGFKNVIRWMSVIWYDADYDWTYLAQIMEYKLRRMARYEENYGHHSNSLKNIKNQRICAELLKRLREDNYFTNAKIRFGQTPRAYAYSDSILKNDQKYLGRLIGKYLNTWWD